MEEVLEFKREKKIESLGYGSYKLSWIDETGAELCSMAITIEGEDPTSTIEQNFALMKRQNASLFVEPMDEEVMENVL